MATWPKISINAYKEFSMCFGCGQDNPIGLKLSFQWDGETTRAEFTPNKLHQGLAGVVHGGIITCILDEAMGYAAYFEGVNCVTAEMRVRLRRPALIDEPLVITSHVTKKTRKLVKTKAAISLKDGTLIADGTATHFVIDSRRREDKPKSNA